MGSSSDCALLRRAERGDLTEAELLVAVVGEAQGSAGGRLATQSEQIARDMSDQLDRTGAGVVPALPGDAQRRHVLRAVPIADHRRIATRRDGRIDADLPAVERVYHRHRITSAPDVGLEVVEGASRGGERQPAFRRRGEELVVGQRLDPRIGIGDCLAHQQDVQRTCAHRHHLHRAGVRAAECSSAASRSTTAARAAGAAPATVDAGLFVLGSITVIVEAVGADLSDRVGRTRIGAAAQAIAGRVADIHARAAADPDAHHADVAEIGIGQAVVGLPTAATARSAAARAARSVAVDRALADQPRAGDVADLGALMPIAGRTGGAKLRVVGAVVLPASARPARASGTAI